MWCPRCNKEYVDEKNVCPKCGCELEDYAPILNEEEREMMLLDEDKPTESIVLPEELEPELLVSVVGEQETLRLVALLEGLRIPCIYRLTQEEGLDTEEWQEEAFEEELADEQSWDGAEEVASDEPIYDILVPHTMIPKAIRILNDDSRRNDEQLLEEEDLPEFEGKEYVAYDPFDEAQYDEEEALTEQADDLPSTEEPLTEEPSNDKKRKGLFGFFGKK